MCAILLAYTIFICFTEIWNEYTVFTQHLTEQHSETGCLLFMNDEKSYLKL